MRMLNVLTVLISGNDTASNNVENENSDKVIRSYMSSPGIQFTLKCKHHNTIMRTAQPMTTSIYIRF